MKRMFALAVMSLVIISQLAVAKEAVKDPLKTKMPPRLTVRFSEPVIQSEPGALIAIDDIRISKAGAPYSHRWEVDIRNVSYSPLNNNITLQANMIATPEGGTAGGAGLTELGALESKTLSGGFVLKPGTSRITFLLRVDSNTLHTAYVDVTRK